MSAREDLAQSIATNLDRIFGMRNFGAATQDYELADALLAEGWGKLAEARAAELEAAAGEMVRLKEIGRKPYAACSPEELASYNSYVRLDAKDQWLRDRAATIRSEP